MKNKPLTKKQRKDLISAWADMNTLCAYLEDVEKGTNLFTPKFNPRDKASKIYKLLEGVIIDIDDSDL